MMLPLACAAEGFLFNMGLLLAVGAQASFILRQGMARRHVMAVVAICCLCDLVLISLGTLSIGALAAEGIASRMLALAGAGFMIVYGARALMAAGRRMATAPDASAAPADSLAATALATLAVTLLNPHVYLDAFLLLGPAAGQYAPAERPWFALGAIVASLGWFTALGQGAALLASLFRRRPVRALLDVLVCAVMWRTAASLLGWA